MKEVPYMVFAYVHHNKQHAALITLEATTDFALRTDIVQELGHKLAMHAAAFYGLDPKAKWLLDDSKTVEVIIQEATEKLGEPLIVAKVSYHKSMGHGTDGYK